MNSSVQLQRKKSLSNTWHEPHGSNRAIRCDESHVSNRAIRCDARDASFCVHAVLVSSGRGETSMALFSPATSKG